jgi:hypothetical protein
MNIRDPLTIQSPRAINPRNLKLHVQRAIEQSGNKNIASVKIVSSNQLKSGDLSIKTASSSDVEALRQFADDWAHRIGSGYHWDYSYSLIMHTHIYIASLVHSYLINSVLHSSSPTIRDSGATVQIPTFGVLVHGIRTSTMDMSRLDEIRAQILQDNRPFIPRADIRHIGWLTRDAAAKTATTITTEFTKPEDANNIIDEGLV